VIEQFASTTAVHPDDKAQVNQYGNLLWRQRRAARFGDDVGIEVSRFF
jgi:hypothetical protein